MNRMLCTMSLLAVLLACGGCQSLVLYLPGFDGVVVDRITGKPVVGAMVVSQTRAYPMSQLINVGGPNSRTDRITLVRTDSRGRFHQPAYFRLYWGFGPERVIAIYNRGYERQRYWQMAGYTSTHGDLAEDCFAKKIRPLRDVNVFRLEPQIETPNEPLLNLLFWADLWARALAYSSESAFRRNLPVLREIYESVAARSDEVLAALAEPEDRRRWDKTLSRLRRLLYETR